MEGGREADARNLGGGLVLADTGRGRIEVGGGRNMKWQFKLINRDPNILPFKGRTTLAVTLVSINISHNIFKRYWYIGYVRRFSDHFSRFRGSSDVLGNCC